MSTDDQRALLIEKIDKYLAGELSTEERTAFEAELNRDAELREELSIQRDLNYTIANQDREEHINNMAEAEGILKDLLKGATLDMNETTEETVKQQPRGVVSMWQRSPMKYAVAAMFVVAFGFVGFWMVNGGLVDNSGNQLYASYYTTPDWDNGLGGNTRGPGAEILAEVKASYAGGDYNTALKRIDKAIDLYPEMYELQFYKGIILLEKGKEKDAEEAINNFIFKYPANEYTGFSYLPHARWYLALAQVKQKKYDDARANLRTLLDDPSTGLDKKAGELYSQIMTK